MNYFSAFFRDAMKMRSANALVVWGLACIGACTALYALTSLALPFGWDHGIIASVGRSYVQGKLPYVDSWDIKGPVAYLPFALAQILFGPTTWGIRLLDILIWAVTGFTLWRGVRQLTTSHIGVGAALATYLWIASSGWFFTAAPESWVAACSVLAIVPMLPSNKGLKFNTVALSGCLIACMGLVKPFYFAFGIAPLIAMLLSSELSLWRKCRLALVLAAGALGPTILIGGYFAIRGGLSQLLEVHILYPISTYLEVRSGQSIALHEIVAFLKTPLIIIAGPFVLLAIWSYRSQPRILVTLLAWCSVALLCLVAQGKYWVYHWFPLYPPLVILTALGVFTIIRTGGRAVGLVATVCSALMLIAVVKRPLVEVTRFGSHFILKRDPEGYYASYSLRLYNAADEIAAARYIAEHTSPQQGVFIWGSDALYFLADRPNPSRFTFVMPLTLPGPYLDIYRAELMRDLIANPPIYFVSGIAWDGLSRAANAVADFPAMANFLSQHYNLEKEIGVLDLYRYRGESGNADGDRGRSAWRYAADSFADLVKGGLR